MTGGVARALGAVIMLAATLAWGSAASAQTAPAQIEILGLTPFVGASAPFTIRLSVTGVPDDATVSIERYDGIADNADPRAQLDAWISGKPRGVQPWATFGPRALAEIREAGGEVTIPLKPDDRTPGPGFAITDAGAYPIVVRVDAADRRPLAEARTFLIRLPTNPNGPPLLVAPIVGLRAPVALKPDGSRALDPGDLDRIRRAERLLRSHPAAELTIDALPETLASSVPGDATGREQRRSAFGSRQVLASTLVDVDVDQWLAAGLRDQLERQRLLAQEAFTDPTIVTVDAADAGTWVARQPLGLESRSTLQQLNAPRVERLVVPAGQVGPVEARNVPAVDAAFQPFLISHAGGAMNAVVSDERLAGRLTATGNTVLDAQATLADLAVLACGSKTGGTGAGRHCNWVPPTARGVALVVPDDTRALDTLDRVLAAAAEGSSIVATAELRDLFALPPATAPGTRAVLTRPYNVFPGSVTDDLSDYAGRLGDTATKVRGFRSMLVEPPPDGTDATGFDPAVAALPADILLQRLDVAGAANARDTPDAYLDAVTAEVAALLARVQAPPHRQITLTSTEGEIQVPLTNDLDEAVTVVVQLNGAKPLFDSGQRSTTIVQHLPARSSSTARIKVWPKGPGSFPIDVRVLSPDESLIVLTTTIEVRSTVVSRLGLALTIAAGLFLAIWWARHFRDARRARKLVDVDEVEAAVAMASGEVPVVGNAEVGPRV